MAGNSTQLPVLCTQCGAALDVREGEVFVTCAHCASALYLDRGEVILHYLVARTLDAQRAEDTLKRWMASAGTAKDLDRLAEVGQAVLRYFPVWRFRVADESGEQVYVEPAAAETLPLLQGVSIPPGELRFYDPAGAGPDPGSHLVQPTIACEAAAKRLGEQEDTAPLLREAALVHVPLYFFQYRHRDETYRAAVDAASGKVLASAFPARQDLAYRLLGSVTFAAFFLAAFSFYWLLYVAGDKLLPALSLRCGVQLLIAVPLFSLAWLVARKV